MGWMKLDDKYHDHPKIVRAGVLGEALDERGIGFCAAYETDGHIHRDQLAKLARGITKPARVVAKLVEVRRWHEPGHDCDRCPPVIDGWYVHDFLDYHPTHAEKEAERAAARERMRKAREAKSARNAGDGSAERSGELRPQFGQPRPVPSRPGPEGASGVAESSSSARERTRDDDEDNSLREEHHDGDVQRLDDGFPISGKPLTAATLLWDDKRRAAAGEEPVLPPEHLAGYTTRALQVGADHLDARQLGRWAGAVLAEFVEQATDHAVTATQRKRLTTLARSWPLDQVLVALEVAVERADSDVVAYATSCLREGVRQP